MQITAYQSTLYYVLKICGQLKPDSGTYLILFKLFYGQIQHSLSTTLYPKLFSYLNTRKADNITGRICKHRRERFVYIIQLPIGKIIVYQF